MQRFSATLLLAVVAVTMLHAESWLGVSAGAGPAFPLRGIKRMFGIGYGGTGSMDLLLNENISVVVRGGYFRWGFNSDRINASAVADGVAAAGDPPPPPLPAT